MAIRNRDTQIWPESLAPLQRAELLKQQCDTGKVASNIHRVGINPSDLLMTMHVDTGKSFHDTVDVTPWGATTSPVSIKQWGA